MTESPTDPGPSKGSNTLGMLCHLTALAGYVIPFGNIIGPLIVWMVKKDEDPFVDDQGKESLNFQITMMIVILICAASICIGIGVVLLPIAGILDLVFVIIASIKAGKGERYRYPFALRLIK
jgi:hypothetical protein